MQHAGFPASEPTDDHSPSGSATICRFGVQITVRDWCQVVFARALTPIAAILVISLLVATTVPVRQVEAQTVISVSFSSAEYAVSEGDEIEVGIVLSSAPANSVTVQLTWAEEETATADDYSLSATSVTFGVNETSSTVIFTANDDDNHFEEDEAVRLAFTSLPSGLQAGSTDETIVSINDSDDPTTADLDALDVTWASPSADSWGSMPVGNGSIGLNVWVENSGSRDLVFYIGTGDAYDRNGELLKLGRVRVSLDPNPFASGATFTQRLRLRKGQIEIISETSSVRVDLIIWVDANNEVIHVKGTTNTDVDIEVELETWRNSERNLTGDEIPINWRSHQNNNISFVEITRGRDHIEHQSTYTDRVMWYHRNTDSLYEYVLEVEELEDFEGDDPLLNRIFGAAIFGAGMNRHNLNTPKLTVDNTRNIDIAIYPHTGQHKFVRQWRETLQRKIDHIKAMGYGERYSAHKAWWADFWNRHWIIVSADGAEAADALTVSQNYALSRFLLAASTRGEQAAHFNGSIFTVELNKPLPNLTISNLGTANKRYDADYRTWGSSHWFQNSRFAYWPLLVSGDTELMHSLFDMYLDAWPLAKFRTKTYYNHDGAYFPETVTGWGSAVPRDYGVDGRGSNPLGWTVVPHKRYHWSGNIELVAMMLDYFDMTQDEAWLDGTIEFMHDIVIFFREHYSEDGGAICIAPSQGLETLRSDMEGNEEIVNPTDHVAGLHFILDRLLALPEHLVSEEYRQYWFDMKSQLPSIAKAVRGGKEIIAASASHVTATAPEHRRVKENVPLYAVFPFRVYGVGKPDLQLARNTFDERQNRDMGGWHQQPIHAVMVGDLADAKDFTVRYFREKEMFGPSRPISQTAFRFPAFYGPSHDYVPNVPQNGNAMIALQSMLVQYDGRRIMLFPTWPEEWNVEFRVHLPYETTLTGRLQEGEVQTLTASPGHREADIEYLNFSPISGARVSFVDRHGFAESLTSGPVEVVASDANSPATDSPTGGLQDRPHGLIATASDGTVVLTWKPPVGLPYMYDYQILRNRPELCEPEPLVYVEYTNSEETAYTDTDVEPGVLYVYRVKVVVDVFGRLGEASQPVEIRTQAENSPATGVLAINGTARVGETLNADTSAISDADGLGTARFTYQWLADDTDIQDATGSTYTLVSDDEGKIITVKVSFTDDAGNEETLTSAPVGPDGPYGLTAGLSGNAVVLTWKPPVGQSYMFDYQILRNRPELGEAEPLVYVTYTETEETTYTDTDVEPGVLYVYRVKAVVDAFGRLGEASEPVEIQTTESTPGENSPATGAPTASGTARVGETLTAETSAIADGDGLDNANFSYQWLADDADIAGATGSSYTLVAADAGKAITVQVRFTDDEGNAETLTSAATSAVAAVSTPLTAHLLDTPPSHDGQTDFTFELRFSEDFSLSYVTLRDHAFTVTGGEVTGARRLDRPGNIRWEITVRPDSDGDVTVVLPATGDCDAEGAVCTEDGRRLSHRTELTVQVPAPANSAATGAPTIGGTAQVGETLTAETSAIADGDGLDNVSFTYQWVADDTDIAGATGSSYTLTDSDAGKAIKVRVSFTDDEGNEETLTSAATSAVTASNHQPEVVPRLREWAGGSGSFVLSGSSRVVVAAGDGSRQFSGDFFSIVLGGLTDPEESGLSEAQRSAARLALADSLNATAYHTASRRTLDQVAAKIRDDIEDLTGLGLAVVPASASVSPRAGDVVVDVLDASDAGIAAEGYELAIGDWVTIRANSTSGVFYGSRTLLQMLAGSGDNTAPRGTARDYPTLGHRLIHLDMNRKYWEMDYLADSFRRMSWVKLNAFKIHFADANGWRLHDPGTAAWSGTLSAAPTPDTATEVLATGSLGAPPGVKVVPGAGSLTVHWNPPSAQSGWDVRSYRVQIRRQGDLAWSPADYRDSAGTGTAYLTVADRSHKFGGLTDGVTYEVRVSADTGFPGLADSRERYQSGDKKWFYDRDDIRMLEGWAAENHISIMPGFEFPGHTSVINDLYETGFADGGSDRCGNAHVYGNVKPGFVLDTTSSRAVAQAKTIMEHFMPWFSGLYVHIGGEEVSAKLANCPRVAAHIKASSSVSSLGDMLTVFFNDLNELVRHTDRSMIIYNGVEHLDPDTNVAQLDSTVVVMDWNARSYSYYGGPPGSSGARHKFMNMRAYDGYYLTSNNFHALYPEESRLYDRWDVEPPETYLGAAIGVWLDYIYWSRDEYTELLLLRPRAILGDRTWNGSTTPDTVNDFYARLKVIGEPPGYEGFTERTRVDDGLPSHHYGFEDDTEVFPPTHFKNLRHGRTHLVRDEAGELHATSYNVTSPSVRADDKRFGASSWEFSKDGPRCGNRRGGHSSAVGDVHMGKAHSGPRRRSSDEFSKPRR